MISEIFVQQIKTCFDLINIALVLLNGSFQMCVKSFILLSTVLYKSKSEDFCCKISDYENLYISNSFSVYITNFKRLMSDEPLNSE